MNALVLPLLFFLHAFHPNPVSFIALGMAAFWHSDYDDWLIDLQLTYNPPNDQILILETIPNLSTKLLKLWPLTRKETSARVVYCLREYWESVPFPEKNRNRFGLVIVEKPKDIMDTQYLEYCSHALVRGGKLLVVEGRKVVMVIVKNGGMLMISPAPNSKVIHLLNDRDAVIYALNDHDITVLSSLMDAMVVPALKRILLVGPATHWIDPLRRKGWVAYGIDTNLANLSIRDVYYSATPTYQFFPFQTEFFQLICVFVEADSELVFEADRVLLNGGFLAFMAQANKEYEEVLQFLRYERTGIVFHGMPIWKKKVGESA